MAEREGFEPSVHLLGVHTISSRAPSASRASLHNIHLTDPCSAPAGGKPGGGEGGIRTHVPCSSQDKSISSRPRYGRFGTSPRTSLFSTARSEKPGQQLGTFRRPNTADDLHIMIESLYPCQVHNTARRSPLGIGGSEHEDTYPCLDHGAKAHDAGFEGDVECRTGKAIVADHPGCPAQDGDLRMSRGITGSDGGIVRRAVGSQEAMGELCAVARTVPSSETSTAPTGTSPDCRALPASSSAIPMKHS